MTRRKLYVGLTVLLIFITIVGLVGSGTYLSSLVRDGGLVPKIREPKLDLVVAGVRDGLITLRLGDGVEDADLLEHIGLFGLKGESSYNQVGDVVSISSGEVRREFVEVTGRPEIGERVSLDSFAYEGDPASV